MNTEVVDFPCGLAIMHQIMVNEVLVNIYRKTKNENFRNPKNL